MSSTAKRGKEGKLTVTDETGKRYPFLVTDFNDDTDMTIEKRTYIGERTPQGDPSFDGITLTFNCDEDDTTVVDLRKVIMQREFDGQAPLKFTLAFREKARKAGVKIVNSIYPGCVLVPKGKGVGGQKDTIKNSFEAYCASPPDVIKQ